MATNLLLLDESLLVQRVVELAFRDTGVDVHMAEDADEALEMAENAPPDIVVASLDMQNSDALDFCRRLREKPGLSQVPLLILTSTRNNVSDEEIEELEATGNIEKPFKPIVFTTEVERILGPGAGVPTPDRKEQAEPDSPEKAMEEETPLPSVDIIGEYEETPPAPVAEEALEETGEAPAETESAASPREEEEQPPSSAPGLDSEKLEPIIQKHLEEAAQKIAPTLLRRIESIVVAQLPDIVEQIVLKEIEKIKRGE